MTEYECNECGRSFDSEAGLASHQGVVDHERIRQQQEIRKLIQDPTAECHVYVLELTAAETGKSHYYVGKSNDVITRIMTHVHNDGDVTLPDGKDGLKRQGYTVNRLIKTIPVKEHAAKNIERKTMLEFAIEKDTTNVFGGK